jgi:vitamin B12 transporter
MKSSYVLLSALSASIAACVMPSLAYANGTQSNQADEVIVTAKGSQTLDNAFQTTHVFNLQDIETVQADDVPSLLNQLVGFSVTDTGGRGSVTSYFMRGLSNSQIIVLIDGVRVGSASLGTVTLNAYPVEAIERIEVLKGPFSGIYGADGVGGVIQLFTKKSGEGLGNVSLTLGSDSLTEVSASLNGGDEKNSFHLSVHAEETDGFDRTSILSGGNSDDDAFEETAFSFGAKLTLGDSTVTKLSALYSDGTADFDNLFGTDPGLKTDTKTFSSALNFTTELSANLIWQNTLGINKDESVTNGDFPSDITTNRDSIGTELIAKLNDSTILTSGLDYYEEEIEAVFTEFPVSERDNKAVYTQLQTSRGDLGLVASLRYDDNSAYGSNTNGSVSLSYQLNDSLRAIASYGTAFAAPSFNFLYFPFFGNPDLLPEESKQSEIRLEGSQAAFNWSISAYQTDVENLFSFDPVTFLAANVGEAEISGWELQANTEIADWQVGISLDLLSAKDVLSNVKLDDRAEKTLKVNASKDFGDLVLAFDLSAESNRFDNQGTELSGFGLLDVRASYQITEQFSLNAKVSNVFDKDYTINLAGFSEHYNTAGRQAKLALKYSF